MAARRKTRPTDLAPRIRHLISLDADNVMKRLRLRQDEMVSLFSRLRDREPMIGSVRSWFSSITFGELAMLEPREQLAINGFYDVLGELRWYLQYTEDMPGTVQQLLALHVKRLEGCYRKLIGIIGPARGAGGPVVEAEITVPTLASGGKRRR